jgi:hypothetical protein
MRGAGEPKNCTQKKLERGALTMAVRAVASRRGGMIHTRRTALNRCSVFACVGEMPSASSASLTASWM